MSNLDREFFIPAQSESEAIERIFALTGLARDRSRGEKRALLALRDALGLDIDGVTLGSMLGAQIAAALDVDWDERRYTERSTVTLDGLNALLEGATEAYQDGLLQQIRDEQPAALTGPEWAAFRPARKKIEAVTRIAALTDSPPETLGPGGKEHKSVFLNLAQALFPDLDADGFTKTAVGQALAGRLGVPWTDRCYSTQQSIQLEGLNTILAGAERYLGRLGTSAADILGTPESEGAALVAALNAGWEAKSWDARLTIEWMKANGIGDYNHNEWQGFYFEGRGRQILNASFPPRTTPVRAKYGNTTFDYSLNHVWDLKAHTESKFLPVSRQAGPGAREIWLNDEFAIRHCVAEQGLGFLVLGGLAVMDEEGEFVEWHRRFKGKPSARANTENSRTRKAAFAPLHVEAYWIPNTGALNAAILAGHLKVKPQGRQAPPNEGAEGAPRADKFVMVVAKARNGMAIARRDWHYRVDPFFRPKVLLDN